METLIQELNFLAQRVGDLQADKFAMENKVKTYYLEGQIVIFITHHATASCGGRGVEKEEFVHSTRVD